MYDSYSNVDYGQSILDEKKQIETKINKKTPVNFSDRKKWFTGVSCWGQSPHKNCFPVLAYKVTYIHVLFFTFSLTVERALIAFLPSLYSTFCLFFYYFTFCLAISPRLQMREVWNPAGVSLSQTDKKIILWFVGLTTTMPHEPIAKHITLHKKVSATLYIFTKLFSIYWQSFSSRAVL